MEESDASWSVSDSVSTLIDAAGRSSGCEDEAYRDFSLACKANHANDSQGPMHLSMLAPTSPHPGQGGEFSLFGMADLPQGSGYRY